MFHAFCNVENTSRGLLKGLPVNDLRHKIGVFMVSFLYLVALVLPVKASLSKNYSGGFCFSEL